MIQSLKLGQSRIRDHRLDGSALLTCFWRKMVSKSWIRFLLLAEIVPKRANEEVPPLAPPPLHVYARFKIAAKLLRVVRLIVVIMLGLGDANLELVPPPNVPSVPKVLPGSVSAMEAVGAARSRAVTRELATSSFAPDTVEEDVVRRLAALKAPLEALATALLMAEERGANSKAAERALSQARHSVFDTAVDESASRRAALRLPAAGLSTVPRTGGQGPLCLPPMQTTGKKKRKQRKRNSACAFLSLIIVFHFTGA